MPLHLKLGAANDCLKIMEQFFNDQMVQFYEDHGFYKGNTPGVEFTGVTISQLISEEKLQALSLYLGSPGDLFIEYLAALRELLAKCNQQTVSGEEIYLSKVERLRLAFEAMHDSYGLSETIKGMIPRSRLS